MRKQIMMIRVAGPGYNPKNQAIIFNSTWEEMMDEEEQRDLLDAILEDTFNGSKLEEWMHDPELKMIGLMLAMDNDGDPNNYKLTLGSAFNTADTEEKRNIAIADMIRRSGIDYTIESLKILILN